MVGSETTSMAQRISAVRARFPHKVLLEDDQTQYTGARLEDFEGIFMSRIQALAPAGDRVGVVLPNSATKAAVILSLMARGRVPVLISEREDPRHLEALLPKLGLRVLVTDQDLLTSAKDMPCLSVDPEGKKFKLYGQARASLREAPRAGTALILYTSGSTGEPKGVQLPERALLYILPILQRKLSVTADDVAAVLLPIAHTMALNTQFLPVFLAGGRSVFFDSTFGLSRIYRDLLKCGGTNVALISELIRLCHQERAQRNLPAATQVRHVTLAGGMIRKRHLDMARELFPNAELHKGYGFTEGIRVSMISSTDPAFGGASAGPLLEGQEAEIRDDLGNVLPPGEQGNLFVRGPNIMLGYDGQIATPIDERGFFETRDLARFDEHGYLTIEGRADGIVKIRGKRVALREIEEAAVAILPAGSEARALAVVNASEEARLALWVELGNGRRADEEFAARFESELRARLHDHHSMPADVLFVQRIPRTQGGKVRRDLLESQWRSRESWSGLVRTKGEDHQRRHYYFEPPTVLSLASEAAI